MIGSAVKRLFRWSPTPGAFVKLSTISLVGLLVILPSGGLVRLTDSGLGCPDWPGCHGEVVPPLQGHAWIEYSNRVLSAIVVALAVITWFFARNLVGRPRQLTRLAAVPAIGGVIQGPLGGLTVLSDLHPLLVSSHFFVSILALAGGVALVIAARDHAAGRVRRTDPRAARLAGLALAALTGVIITGILVTAAGPHSGDPAVFRRLGNLSTAAAVHVRFVIAFVVVALGLAMWLIRSGRFTGEVRRASLLFLPLLAVQVALGEYQYRNELPWEVIVWHVTVAGLVWGCGVAIAWMAGRPVVVPAADQDVASPAVAPDLAASPQA